MNAPLFCSPIRLAFCGVVCAMILTCMSPAPAADLAFKPADREGCYEFDTGVIKGTLRLDGKLQGIETLVHVPSGLEVTYGDGHAGLLGHYRVFSTGTRYADDARNWPSRPKLRGDGTVEVFFPAGDDHPLEMTAIYRLTSVDTIDLETIVRPLQPMPRFEIFLSNYLSDGFVGSVYMKPPRFARKVSPALTPVEFNPLIEDNYLIFPRDREAVRTIFDGRWDQPPSPVEWSITRYLAGPLAQRRHEKTGVTVAIMAPPEDCFAVATPYDRTPPDRVAGHRSLYLSLFGRDLAKGETARARSRLVVKQGLADDKLIELFRAYSDKATSVR